MFSKEFLEILNYECAVGIATCAHGEAHISNTWNRYLVIKGDRILIPAAGMKKTQSNVEANPNVELSVATKELVGRFGAGRGFVVKGTARFIDSGAEFEETKAKFPFATRLLEITASSVKQVL